MTELTAFTDATPDLTRFEKDNLRLAGASEALIQMCDTEISYLKQSDGSPVDRHSVLTEVKKYTRKWEDLDEVSAHNFTHLGGGFFSKIWDGELYEAYNCADPNNKAIMLEAFNINQINSGRKMHQSPINA